MLRSVSFDQVYALSLKLRAHGRIDIGIAAGDLVARLTGVPTAKASPGRQALLANLARLRESTATSKTSPTTEEILDDLRSERR